MRRCSSLPLQADLALIRSSIREKRITIITWLIGGALAMYFEAIAIAAELRDYPGGPTELAKSIMPTIEGMRIIRWPADRLDTLGGYLTYHNVTLFTYFLALFAALQGAKLIRHLEEEKTIDIYLATGISRTRLTVLRSLSYLSYQVVISLGLGIGTAFALAASDEPNTSGSLITLLASGICIFPFFGLGLLLSQLLSSSRTASGVASIIVTAIYILGNIADKYSWLHWVNVVSPFHYANLTRPVIPGFHAHYWSWAIMLAVGGLIIYFSIVLLNRRDIFSIAYARVEKRNKVVVQKKHFVPRTIIGDALWRQRYGIMAWTITTTAFIAVFVSMMSGIVDIWEKFDFLQQFSTSGFGETAQSQYLAMVYEILPPFLAGFIITQSAKWSSDVRQGRVQLFLSAPFSWTALVVRRIATTIIGTTLMVIFSVAAIFIGSTVQETGLFLSGAGRVVVMMTLFSITFTAICALLVAILNGKNATQVLSLYIGAAWLVIFMAPYLNWPDWVLRLSIFHAFGHPFIDWPSLFNFVVIGAMIVPSLVLTRVIVEDRPKVV